MNQRKSLTRLQIWGCNRQPSDAQYYATSFVVEHDVLIDNDGKYSRLDERDNEVTDTSERGNDADSLQKSDSHTGLVITTAHNMPRAISLAG